MAVTNICACTSKNGDSCNCCSNFCSDSDIFMSLSFRFVVLLYKTFVFGIHGDGYVIDREL